MGELKAFLDNKIVWLLFVTMVGFGVWFVQRAINAKAASKKEAADKEEKRKLAEEAKQAAADKEEAEAHKKEITFLRDAIAALQTKDTQDTQTLALLKQEMLPMSEFMKQKLVEILMHPSPEFKAPDDLLEEVLVPGALVGPKLQEFLDDRVASKNKHVSEREKLAAKALPIIAELAKMEAEDENAMVITAVQLVTSTVKSTATKKEEEKDDTKAKG